MILAMWVGLALLLSTIARFAPSKAGRVACLLSGSFIFLFTFSSFSVFLRQFPLLGVEASDAKVLGWWLCIGALIGIAMWFVSRYTATVRFLNVAAVSLLLLAGVSILQARGGSME